MKDNVNHPEHYTNGSIECIEAMKAMMEGSRTGKAAEADLMILIAKNPPVEGQDEEDSMRHLNLVKNKLTGWHGIVHSEFNYKTARYES